MTQNEIDEIIQAIKDRYIQDFKRLDEQAYFMAGFVADVLQNVKITNQYVS